MLKRSSPGVDREIEPQNGVTRDGQPLSYNRAPAADLAPWVARLYVTQVNAPPDHLLACGLFNDTAFVRMQLRGAWTAETATGPMAYSREVLFFGPQSRRMPVAVRGSFTSLGISLRPGASHVFDGLKVSEYLDTILRIEDSRALDWFDERGSPEDWVRALEELVRLRVESSGGKTPDSVTASFEALAFTDPGANIAEFAHRNGIEQRRLERIVRRDFGMPPKQVLRRARVLDMASHLRGVADEDEAEELILRFYDQSHLIREFTDLLGMSPKQFLARPQPILTLALESRQARRLEALERLKPGARRPWEQPVLALSRTAS